MPQLKHTAALTLLLLTTLLLGACERADSPEQVSEKFWTAVQSGDMNEAQKYAVDNSINKDSLRMSSNQFESKFEAAVIDGDSALVPTTHTGQHNGAPLSYQFNTALTRVDQQWQVDVEKTLQSLVPAAMGAAFSGFGAALNQSLNNLGDVFGQEANKIGGLLGQVLNQSLEEVSREIEKASADMSQSAKDASNSGMELATELTKELSQELQNAGSIYQQKIEQWQAEQASQTANNKSIPTSLPASISGEINGTSVLLTQARYQQALELYSGDSWGSNPSLLVFLFLDGDAGLAGQSIEVNAADTGSLNPHVHLRWIDPVSGLIETEIATGEYDLSLQTGKADTQGNITGTISFSKDGTSVSGSFTVKP